MNEEPNGWNTWAKYVLKSIERIDENVSSIEKEMVEIKQQITRLESRMQARAGMWGAIGACIPAAIAIAISLLT